MDCADICAGCGCSLRCAKETGSTSIYDPGGPDFELCMPCWDHQEALIEETGTNVQPVLLDRYYATFGERRPKLYDALKNETV
jgi:hypothetical protein